MQILLHILSRLVRRGPPVLHMSLRPSYLQINFSLVVRVRCLLTLTPWRLRLAAIYAWFLGSEAMFVLLDGRTPPPRLRRARVGSYSG